MDLITNLSIQAENRRYNYFLYKSRQEFKIIPNIQDHYLSEKDFFKHPFKIETENVSQTYSCKMKITDA